MIEKDFFVCPLCKEKLEKKEERLLCLKCNKEYKIINSVFDFSNLELSEETKKTVEQFGKSWEIFSHIEDYHKKQFLEWIYPLKEEDFKDKVVLEAGCGKGRHSVIVSSFNPKHLFAVDLSEAIFIAEKNFFLSCHPERSFGARFKRHPERSFGAHFKRHPERSFGAHFKRHPERSFGALSPEGSRRSKPPAKNLKGIKSWLGRFFKGASHEGAIRMTSPFCHPECSFGANSPEGSRRSKTPAKNLKGITSWMGRFFKGASHEGAIRMTAAQSLKGASHEATIRMTSPFCHPERSFGALSPEGSRRSKPPAKNLKGITPWLGRFFKSQSHEATIRMTAAQSLKGASPEGAIRMTASPSIKGQIREGAVASEKSQMSNQNEDEQKRIQVTFARSDLKKIPFLDNSFDLIFCVGVLHHIDNTEEALQELWRVLKPQGKLVLWVYGREGNFWIIYFINPLRKFITSKIPTKLLRIFAFPITLFLYFLIKTIYGPITKWGKKESFLYYSSYLGSISPYPFKEIDNIVVDHLCPSIAHYLSKEDIENLVKPLYPSEVKIRWHNKNSWNVLLKKG